MMEHEEYEITLGEIFEILKKKWLLIVMTTLVGTALAMGVSMELLTPMYESSSTMLVNYKQNEGSIITYSDYQMSTNLVSTYSEVVKSRRVLTQVVDELDLDVSIETLAGLIAVSPVADTSIVRVTVTNEDPELATDIANSLSDVFQEEIQDMLEVDSVTTIDEAIEPTAPVSPNVMLNTVIGAMLGLVLSVLLALVLAMMDRTVKTAADVTRYLDLPVIGSIPDFAIENKK